MSSDEEDKGADPTGSYQIDPVAFMRHQIANKLCELTGNFTRHRITLVARSLDQTEEAVIVTSDDDLRAVSAALIRQAEKAENEAK